MFAIVGSEVAKRLVVATATYVAGSVIMHTVVRGVNTVVVKNRSRKARGQQEVVAV